MRLCGRPRKVETLSRHRCATQVVVCRHPVGRKICVHNLEAQGLPARRARARPEGWQEMSDLPDCANCRKQNKTCWQHTVADISCKYCGTVFTATQKTKACTECLILRSMQRFRSASGPALVDKTCTMCLGAYRGSNQSRYCVPCLVAQTQRKQQAYADRLKASYRAGKPKPAPVNSKLPPPCQQCHYCKETDMYPSGMVCLAEAFMRCQPWSPNAKPLKEKESAST